MLKRNATRIKMCGITTLHDALAAVNAGADALGFVFYAPSPRYITPAVAATIIAKLPPFVSTVGLFVNHSADEVQQAVASSGVGVLQFHGTETPDFCIAQSAQHNKPYLKAVHIAEQAVSNSADGDEQALELLKYCQQYSTAQGLLFDTASAAWGGTGQTFQWSKLLPLANHPSVPPLVLSGGLNAQNVAAGIALLRPWAVDVSSGIEQLGADGKPIKGVKNPAAMHDFVQAVRTADLK